jgi:hypothetical protein
MKTFKFDWGTGIFALYVGFVLMIIALVVMSSTKKIDLVTDKYYNEELQFQTKINKKNNTKALETPLTWKVTSDQLLIQYPAGFADNQLTGTIKFYCPSDDSKDREFKIKSIDSQQQIAFITVPNGRYLLQFDWNNGSEKYWNEGAIVVKK